MTITSLATPRFPIGVRLRVDAVRDRTVLLYPEGALALNETAALVLELVDGKRTIADIAAELKARYETDVTEDVQNLIQSIAAKGLLNVD